MKAFARINRLERLLNKPVHGIRYTMRDGSWRILPFQHRGFYDAVQHHDTPEARVVLNAKSTTQGPILNLFHAVMHPIETESSVAITAEV